MKVGVKTMKKLKILILLMTSILLIGVIPGCSSDDAGREGEDGETVTLTVWGDADNQATLEPAFEKINDAFMEKYPNIKIDYQWTGTIESINVAMQTDSLPDLFWVQGNKSTVMAEMARNGYIIPLDKYNLDISRFPKESVEYCTVDGKLYCSPPSFIAYVTIYYNKNIFDKYGLKVPETWDEFEKVVKVLADNGVTPIAVGGKGDFDRYWILQAMAASLSTDVLQAIVDGKEDIDFSNLETTFELYREFATKGYFGKDVASIDGAGAQLAFTNGKAAMIADGTWNNSTYRELGMNIGSFALPGMDGKRYAQSGPYNANTYAISSKSKHPDQAVKYLKFLMSKEAQQIIADETGQVPMLDDIQPKDDAVKELAAFDKIGLNIYNILSQVADENSKPHDLLLTELAPKLMMGKMTGKEAVQLLKAELNKRSK